MNSRSFVRLLTYICCLSSCVSEGRGSADFEVLDSAGVTVIVNAEPAWADTETWRLQDTRISIGSATEPSQSLHRVTNAALLQDGSVAIANDGSGQILIYSIEGKLVRSLGGHGEGPGEFQSVSWMAVTPDDSIVAWDRNLNRVTILTVQGPVRDYQPALPENLSGHVARGIIAGRRIVFTRDASFVPTEERAHLQRQPIEALVLGDDGELVSRIGPFEGEEVVLRAGRSAGTTLRTPVPYGAATVFAAGDGRLYVADNQRYETRVFESDGRLSRIVRRPFTTQPPSTVDWTAYIEARVGAAPPIDEIRAGIRASFEDVPRPQHLPVIGAMLVATDGYMWVQAHAPATTDAAVWTVFDPAGRWLGDLTLPRSEELLHISRDAVVTRGTDELGVESVRLLNLER